MNKTRQQQLLSLIKRIVSTELMEIDHELFHDVVVTHVHLSNNGQECRVFVATSPENLKRLNTEYKNEIQRLFMKQFARKTVPHISFHADQGEVEHMEEILAQENSDNV